MDIYYIDRKTGEKKKEIVAGSRYLKWMYETKVGSSVLEILIKRKFFSNLYGKLQDLSISKRKIGAFVKELNIDMKEAKKQDINQYKNFNEFFSRKLKEGARPIPISKELLISPADGRIMAYEKIDIFKVLQIKGQEYSLEELLQDKALAEEYKNGTCVVVRLNPSDYHRFHFPADGTPMESKKIEGSYYSVNPIALKKIVSMYCQNKREITIFPSDNFGKILLVEVGATCVGSIKQTYQPNKWVQKGEEKGYFKFGGSTVILFLKENMIKIDEDIIENSNKGLETKVNMGEGIALGITSRVCK